MNTKRDVTGSSRLRCKFFQIEARLQAFAILAFLACSCGLAAYSSVGPGHAVSSATATSQPNYHTQSSGDINSRQDENLAGKSPGELAAYVFEHHHCNGCHTMGAGGQLGFNDRGKAVGKDFEGCISLLTSMNVIAQVKPANRTAEEKHKTARFQEFGCTTCHQIVPGKLGLTDYGRKLKSLHMACTDVEKILAK